jgi:cobalt-zinc-cadmium efflux system outer membrane protein
MRLYRSRIGIAYGERIQAGLWPNPDLEVSTLDERHYKTEAFISLAQRFELGGKREARVSVAGAQVFLAETELRETWVELRAAVKDAFARLAYARQRADLLNQVAAADAERLKLTESLLEVGRIPEQELLREKQTSGRSLAAAQASAQVVEDAQRQVLTLLGMADAKGPVDLVCSLDASAAVADAYEELLALARKNSPVLASSRARVAVAEAGLNLARTRQWSDVSVGLGFMYVDYAQGEPGRGVVAAVKADLPVWDRHQGDILAARHGISAAEEGTEVAARGVASKLSELLADRQGWLVQAESLREQILPASKRSVELADNALASGKSSKLELLERRRELALAELDLLQARLMSAVLAIQLEKIAADVSVPPTTPAR